MNITEFLLARIAEDEKDAIDRVVLRAEDRRSLTMDDAEKIHAEIAAKRAIVDLAKKASEFEKWYDDYEWQGTVEGSEPLTGDAILYALAAVYKDHADYDPAWSPNGG